MKTKLICYGCGLSDTRTDKDGYQMRYLNHDLENNFLCCRCYNRYIHAPKWRQFLKNKYGNMYSPRRIQFKDKRIFLNNNPRIGVCSKCGATVGNDIKRTNLHHIEYHEEDPLKDVIELCVSCHKREHIKK